MANLAIRGHATRGKEVVEILEMLGGKSYTGLAYKGEDPSRLYCINNENNFIDSPLVLKDVQIFSLEKFLEKFPYKVGDKVYNIIHNEKQTITNLIWDSQENEVVYKTNNNEYVYVNYLQPYKEKTMEERKYANLRMDVDQDDKLATEATIDGDKITPPENYLIGKITKVDNGMIVEFVKKQPQYPKTYEECCKILDWNHRDYDRVGYKSELFCKLQVLLLCRDAYWKLAGEQMGLGKPWEPNWRNSDEDKHCIEYSYGRIDPIVTTNIYNYILAFPTAKMRDAFYENFKDLIEKCKELL